MNDLSASVPEPLKPRSVDRVWRYVFAAVALHVAALGLVWWSLSSEPPSVSGMSGVVIVDLVSLGPNETTPSGATPTDPTPIDATPTDSGSIENASSNSPRTETTSAEGLSADRLRTPEAVLPEPEPELQARPDRPQELLSEPSEAQPLREVSIDGAREPLEPIDGVQESPLQSQPTAKSEPAASPTLSPSPQTPPSAALSPAPHTPAPPAPPSPPSPTAGQPAPVRAAPAQPRQSPGAPTASDQRPVGLPESGAASVDVSYWHNPAPAYPARALRQRAEGTVLLEVQVLSSGQSGEIKLQSSSGSTLLDEAAINAVKTWRFRPAEVNGRPVAQWINVPITFRIQDR